MLDVPIAGAIASVDGAADNGAIIALGNNATRKIVAEQHPTLCWQTVVHPNADVHPSVTLGAGEKTVLRYDFSIEYPKGMSLLGLP